MFFVFFLQNRRGAVQPILAHGGHVLQADGWDNTRWNFYTYFFIFLKREIEMWARLIC